MELLFTTETSSIYVYKNKWVVKEFSDKEAFKKEESILQKLHETLEENQKPYFCLNVDNSVIVDAELPEYSLVFPYFSMNFHDYLRDYKQIEAFDMAAFDEKISKALDVLHSHRFVHNDLKPQNIFVRLPNTFVLGDFGLTTWNKTHSDNPIGTPLYMSPLTIDNYIHPMNDKWSYACTLINALTLHYVDASNQVGAGGDDDEDDYEDDFDLPPRNYLNLFESNNRFALLYAIRNLPETLRSVLETLSSQTAETLVEVDRQATQAFTRLSHLKNKPDEGNDLPCSYLVDCLSTNRYLRDFDGWVFLTDSKRKAIIQKWMEKVLQILLDPTWLSMRASR